MHKVIGFVLLGIGAVLLILGISSADSLASSFSRLFTGEPTSRAVWLIVSGVGCLVGGGALVVMSRRALKS